MARAKKKGLGRGLDALLGGTSGLEALARDEAAPLPDGSRLIALDPKSLSPNPKQPRRVFSEEALEELAESIRRDGVQEPILVRARDGGHELVSGERRVRACVMAGLTEIPAICRDVSDRDMLKLGLIENIQREDLNAIELAQAYQQLSEEFAWTQEQLADEVGKKRATVANTLRLLSLPDLVQEMLADGALSMGHARAILAIGTVQGQMKAARKTVKEGLSVRQVEKLAAGAKSPAKAKKEAAGDPHLAAIEDDLRRVLGTRVSVKKQNKERGRIEIEYFSSDELERLLSVLRGGGGRRGKNPLRGL